MIKNPILNLLAACLLVGAFGCADEEPPPTVETPDCVEDSDCGDANACTDDVCVEGECQNEAIECDDGVGCTEDSCDPDLGCAFDADDAACDDGLFCNGTETCDPVDGCLEGEAPGDDGIDCTVAECDEDTDEITQAPDDAACDDGLFCNGVEVCDVESGGCKQGEDIIDDGIDCTVDECDEDADEVTHGPDDAACDDGFFCTGAETCDVNLGCQNNPLDLSDEIDCTGDFCDEDLDEVVHIPDSGLCDDGLFCNGVEVCDVVDGCVGGEVPGDDGIDCTVAECDEDTDEITQAPDDAACDDGLFCNGVEVCLVGLGCQEGEDIIDDGIDCTVDECDEDNDQVNHSPSDAACDDGFFCTGVETCDVNLGCQSNSLQIDDEIDCTSDGCNEDTDEVIHIPNDSACDDGLFCTGEEICLPDFGCNTVELVLDDGIDCTVDECDEENDRVLNTPEACECVQDADCVATCQVGTCVDNVCAFEPAEVGAACDDGVTCTLNDTCDDQQTCAGSASDEACDDGFFCTGVETCDPVNDCQNGTPPLDDGVDCTVDGCNEETDEVIHIPNDGFCNDGLFCNGEETCDAINDCQDGAIQVDDGVDCTVDNCDEDADEITNTPSDELCDDGLFCNGAETCDAVNDCQAGAEIVDDGVVCTVDNCDEETNTITNIPDNGLCQDTFFCNGAEICDPVDDCQPGIDIVDDGVGCTVDFCNENTDEITNTPNDSLCDDNLFCNGVETCDPIDDCQAGDSPADDGVSCTVDFCNEDQQAVVSVPDDNICSDGFFCNGEEECDPDDDCGASEDRVVIGADRDPDAFRHIVSTSTGIGRACTHTFIDIEETGDEFIDGDDVVRTRTLGGQGMSLYGERVQNIRVDSNGWISTNTASTTDFSNACAPAFGFVAGGNRLMVLFDDLVGQVYHQFFEECPREHDFDEGRGCNIIMWDVRHFGQPEGTEFKFEVIIYDGSEDFVIAYADGNTENGSGSTTGIVNIARDDSIEVACNEAGSIVDNSSICIYDYSPNECIFNLP